MMMMVAPPPMARGRLALRGNRDAMTKALRVSLTRIADAANLGHPCGKLVMQHGKCETP